MALNRPLKEFNKQSSLWSLLLRWRPSCSTAHALSAMAGPSACCAGSHALVCRACLSHGVDLHLPSLCKAAQLIHLPLPEGLLHAMSAHTYQHIDQAQDGKRLIKEPPEQLPHLMHTCCREVLLSSAGMCYNPAQFASRCCRAFCMIRQRCRAAL